MRITLKWLLTAGLFLPLCVTAYPVTADDGQLSSWEDSKFIDYPPPPKGGWEPLVPIYKPDTDSKGDVNGDTQSVNSGNQGVAAPAPAASAPQAGTATGVPSTTQMYAPPVAPPYAPGWRPAFAPGYSMPTYDRGYAMPGYNPAVARPGYPAPVITAPGFNRGYAPPYPVPGSIPGNHGNPWNDGHPGGWAATPWGEGGPAGWTYPTAADSADGQSNAQNAANAVPGAADTGATAPTDAVDPPGGTAKTSSAPVPGFNWNMQ